MVTLTITSKDGSHSAHCGFGATDHGSPLDSMDAFLKQLKSGKTTETVQKVSKSGNDPIAAAPWLPMQDVDLGDDFRPFVGKKLTKIDRTTYVCEV